jgi:beta-phosphoglucomutase
MMCFSEKNHCTALIFDMDGVMVDNLQYHRIAWNSYAEQLGFGNIDLFNSIGFGATNRRYLEFLFKRSLSDAEVSKMGEEKEALYRDLFSDHIKPVQGLIPLLKRLKSNGLKLGVATSSPLSNLDFVLDRLELRMYFDVLVYEGLVKQGKPNPEIYLKALSLLNVNADQCVVVEDSMHGAEAAKAAGCKVIGLLTSLTSQTFTLADVTAKTHDEITDALIASLFPTDQ